MHKMWSFSTLQRPTQEEKERRRKYKEDKIRHANTLLPKSKVGRAKTFRERNNNEIEESYFENGPTSLPVSASMVEVLRHRAKSASRVADNYYGDGVSTNKRKNKSSATTNTGFVSRLRFLDQHHEPQKLRWQDREPSSGYSSGGRNGHADQEPGTSDDNIYGVKFASMPSEVFMTSTSTMPRKR